MVTWTKNQRTGKYDIIAPSGVVVGDIVEVTRKNIDVTTRVVVDSVSRSFVAKFGALKGKDAVICRVSRMTATDVKPETPRAITLRRSKPDNVVDAVSVAPSVTPNVVKRAPSVRVTTTSKTRAMAF